MHSANQAASAYRSSRIELPWSRVTHMGRMCHALAVKRDSTICGQSVTIVLAGVHQMNRELDRAIGAGAHDDALVFDGRCDWGEWQTGHGLNTSHRCERKTTGSTVSAALGGSSRYVEPVSHRSGCVYSASRIRSAPLRKVTKRPNRRACIVRTAAARASRSAFISLRAIADRGDLRGSFGLGRRRTKFRTTVGARVRGAKTCRPGARASRARR